MDVQHTPAPAHAEGIKGFMTNDTAGMPNWVWLLVIAGGIGLALVVKRMTATKATGNTAPTTGAIPDSGLGLAIDPTTGLPYAVEGLVPSGQSVGSNPPPPVPTPVTPPPAGTGDGDMPPPAAAPPPTPKPVPVPVPVPGPTPQAKFVTVQKWPDALSTLWGISQKYGLTLTRIEQLNPQIKDPSLIFAGQQVRIA